MTYPNPEEKLRIKLTSKGPFGLIYNKIILKEFG